MNIIITVTATLYALLLWLFAPQSVWDKELNKAKSKLEPKSTNPIMKLDEPVLSPKPLPVNQNPPKTYTIKELRKIAQQQNVQWKDENGKPLRKYDLLELLNL